MEQQMESIATSQAAQQYTYAMLNAPNTQIRGFAQVSDHGLGDYAAAAGYHIFDQTYATNGS